MIKNLASLELKVNDHLYQFICEANSPIQEVKEALMQFIGFAAKIPNSPPAQAPEEPKPEAPKE